MCSITCLLIQEYIFNPCWPKWLEFICFNCYFILLFKHTRTYFYILLLMCWLYTVKNRVESTEKWFCWIIVTHISNLLDVTKLFSQVLELIYISENRVYPQSCQHSVLLNSFMLALSDGCEMIPGFKEICHSLFTHSLVKGECFPVLAIIKLL